MRAWIVVLPFISLFACSDNKLRPDEVKISCPDNVRVTSTVSAPVPGQTVTGDLVLTGAAEHDEGLTIRTLSVLGVQATNKGFNFDSWQATVPLATLLAHTDTVTADGREVVLTLEATEACNQGATVDVIIEDGAKESPDRRLYVEPPVRLGSLTASVVYDESYKYSDGETIKYLPANGDFAADLTVSVADATLSGGARVQLDATGVLFDDIPDRTAQRLTADGTLDMKVRSNQVGTTSLLIRAGDDTTGAQLRVGGTPILSPAALVLGAGDSAVVSGSIAGDVAAEVTCTVAATSPSATVKPLAGDVLAFDARQGDAFGFTVEVADPATPGLVTISCVEVAYKQAGKQLVVVIE